MDDRVIAAMARWPDVPDIFGWLSLNAAGHWRLHPDGDALAQSASADTQVADSGVPISHSQTNQFINQNYAKDARCRWYFQNGPQRVYVRLDVAPFVLHTIDAASAHPAFLTHNGLRTRQVNGWCLDDTGYLYADTDLGPGLVAGRDLVQVADNLTTSGGLALSDAFGSDPDLDSSTSVDVRWNNGAATRLHFCRFEQVPELLGFVRNPRPDS